MLLPLYHHNSVLPPKILTNLSSPLFITHKPFTPRNSVRPSKFFIQCSTPQDPQATSKSENVPKSAIQRIADKLRSLGIVEQTTADKTLDPEPGARDANSPGEIFIPLPSNLPKHRVGHTFDASWSTPENPVPQPGSGPAIVGYNELREEVNKQKQLERKPKERVPLLAELKLSPAELRRLRTIGIGLKKKLKVGKAGITEGIVNGIHERWRNVEVVKIVCDDICRLNMKRTHDLLERKTGGLVVWRSGSKIILYRGPNYKYPYFLSDNSSTVDASLDGLADARVDSGGLDTTSRCSSNVDGVKPSGRSLTSKRAQPALVSGVGSPDKVRFQLPGEEELVEEADRLLDGLGPRFKDWWGYDPQPVDADLLPAVVPGYRRPFRLLPYGVHPKLTNDEMTTLKRLGRPLPCHFALGRNRKHQGLAAAIVKLWEKCEIAKIAIKRGVQNTSSELMAEELKWLTGGTLISRDKEFIVLYRGKDFLPSAVSSAIEERRKHGTIPEKQSTELSTSSKATIELKLRNMEDNSGDDVEPNFEDEFGKMDDKKNLLCYKHKDLRSSEAAIRRTSIKLSLALEKKAKAEKLLAELEEKEIPQPPELDKEGITEEERYMLRKVGLRMRAFLLMGRRGAFDGTVENMHLHWKYRELVKIISKQKSMEAVYEEARTLERESGGILVAVERVSKGHAIIMYRGKNYERPASLRPKTLLTKRQALQRSIEAQRHQSLKLHVLELTRNINKLKFQLSNRDELCSTALTQAKDKDVNTMQSVDESVLPLVKEEIEYMQSAECVGSHTEFQPLDNSQSVIPTSYEVTEEVRSVRLDFRKTRNEHGADINCMKSNNPVDAITESVHATQQDKLIDFYSTIKGTQICRTEFESSSESVSEQTQQVAMAYSAIVNAEDCSSDTEPIEPPLKSAKNGFEPSVPVVNENGWNEMPSRVAIANAEDCSSDIEPIESPHKSARSGLKLSSPVVSKEEWNEMPPTVVNLSNRDRLILRKQALKMKKRPVLAVGRSNIVTGVAKAIKAHFLKHPLAIVNVKSRAKGTSVQEVVSKLQEATGAVLVSQEPSKVILYRGWGSEDDFGRMGKKNGRDKTAVGRDAGLQPAVSPELLAAIRLECGLQDQQGHETTPVAGL